MEREVGEQGNPHFVALLLACRLHRNTPHRTPKVGAARQTPGLWVERIGARGKAENLNRVVLAANRDGHGAASADARAAEVRHGQRAVREEALELERGVRVEVDLARRGAGARRDRKEARAVRHGEGLGSCSRRGIHTLDFPRGHRGPDRGPVLANRDSSDANKPVASDRDDAKRLVALALGQSKVAQASRRVARDEGRLEAQARHLLRFAAESARFLADSRHTAHPFPCCCCCCCC